MLHVVLIDSHNCTYKEFLIGKQNGSTPYEWGKKVGMVLTHIGQNNLLMLMGDEQVVPNSYLSIFIGFTNLKQFKFICIRFSSVKELVKFPRKSQKELDITTSMWINT